MNDKRTRPLQLYEPIVTGNVKAAAREAGATSSDLWKVSYDRIHYDPRDNVRPLDVEWAKHIGKLIAANGYDWSQPLHCYIRKVDGENLYYVTKGQHRYHGIGYAIAAGVDVGPIPVVVMDGKSVNRADLIFGGLTSNESKRSSPLELAEKIAELRDVHGFAIATICERLQITDQTIRDLALLETAPSGLHKIVREGAVAGTLAIEEIRKHGPEKALERLSAAIVEAKAAGKTKATKKHVAKAATAPASKKISEPQAKSLLQALQGVLHDSGFGNLSPGSRDAVHKALEPLADLLDAKQAAKVWPVTEPDAEGLCDALDVIEFEAPGKTRLSAQIRTAQPAAGVWIHSIMYNLGTSFASGPLKVYRNTRASWTRVQAIRAGASDLIAALTTGRRYSKAEQAAGEKVVNWAQGLLNQSDPDWSKDMSLAAAKNQTPDLAPVLASIDERARMIANRNLLDAALPAIRNSGFDQPNEAGVYESCERIAIPKFKAPGGRPTAEIRLAHTAASEWRLAISYYVGDTGSMSLPCTEDPPFSSRAAALVAARDQFMRDLVTDEWRTDKRAIAIIKWVTDLAAKAWPFPTGSTK